MCREWAKNAPQSGAAARVRAESQGKCTGTHDFYYVHIKLDNSLQLDLTIEKGGFYGWIKIVREPGPMKHGSTVIAFVEDPNGYKIELIQTAA